jgi:hypothetical protein
MSDIAILKEMIKQTATVTLIDYQNKKKVILEEKSEITTSNKKSNYSFEILGLPSEDCAIVIKVDDFKSPDSIFNGGNGECKRSDFVIVADLGKEKFIVFLEMKAGDGGDNSGIVKQLKGAGCFIKYCKEIGRSFWNKGDFLEDYEPRFVAILKIASNVRKGSTVYKAREFINDTPEKMFKISNRIDIQFRMLV